MSEPLKQTIVITGGAGFIGGCLVRHLVAENIAHVVNVDKLTYAGNLDSLVSVLGNPLHTFVEADIGDGAKIEQVLHVHRPAAIINLAAESHVDRTIDCPSVSVQSNVIGTFRLLEAARNYWQRLEPATRSAFRFLHVSTDEVYGSLGAVGSFTEQTAYAPNSPYSASKAAADHFVRAYHHTYGLPTLITNCSNNYGPFQFPEKLIPLMTLNALDGKKLPVYGDGRNIRDWLYVEDHCRALLTVLQSGTPGDVYNIGGNCERTNLEVVQAICETVDQLCPSLSHIPCRTLITFVKDRPGHDRRYAIDGTKLRTQLGWKPSLDFASGLASTVKWYMDNRRWVERVMSGGYQRQRLGLSASP
jgi:dTDP-glucose 4,6-dehydratase